jgi:nitrogenase subunit NifH
MAEELGKTVMEAFPDSEMADEYRRLAGELMKG